MPLCDNCCSFLRRQSESIIVVSSRCCELCQFLCHAFRLPLEPVSPEYGGDLSVILRQSNLDKPPLAFHPTGSPDSLIYISGYLSSKYEGFAPLGPVALCKSTDQLSSRAIWCCGDDELASFDQRALDVLSLLEQCQNDHAACQLPYFLTPTRLLDVRIHNHLDRVRLVCMKDIDSPIVPRYTTLSYCWGSIGKDNSLLKTTQATEAIYRKSGILFKTLPRTFRDAITITKLLGVRYIWIDSLCIIQDDKADWQREAANMANIYEGSYLTIAASESVNSHGGCHLDSVKPSTSFQACLTGVDSAEAITIFARHELAERHMLWKLPLYQRGWVLQEMALSPRILHMTRHQFYWKCRQRLTSEDGTMDEASPANLKALMHEMKPRKLDFNTRESAIDIWWDWIREYTSLQLSHCSDRMAAITGIIRFYERKSLDTPILGLWKSTFAFDLDWFPISDWNHVIPNIPSWSWLGVGAVGHLEWPDKWGSKLENMRLSVSEWSIQWRGEPFTSDIASCRLQVCAILLQMAVSRAEFEEQGRRHSRSVHEVDRRNEDDRGVFGFCEFDVVAPDDESIVTCMFLFSRRSQSSFNIPEKRSEHFLVLQEQEAYPEPGSIAQVERSRTYRRTGWGYFSTYPDRPGRFDGIAPCKVELV